SERREALLMGIAHGAFCVGCCWSLMLVMFGVGISSLSAMLVLGGITSDANQGDGRTRGERRDQATAGTHAAILAAARARLLSDGYANLSTRSVAEAAEVPLSQI